MALVLKDRVRETTTTTGTGNYVLAGAVTGYESFAGIGDGNTTYYACTNGTDWEVGIGTYTASGTILARTTILESSNSDSAVNWAAGSKTIFVTQPSEKAVYLDASGNLDVNGTGAIKVPVGTTAQRPTPATGQLRFNSTDSSFEGYDGSAWGAIGGGSENSFIVYEYTATASQTTFSGADDNGATLSYTAGNIQLMLNGVVLDSSDYTASNGTSVVLASGAALNDVLNVYAFTSFSVADTVSASAGGTFSANIDVTGTITSDGLTVDGSGLFQASGTGNIELTLKNNNASPGSGRILFADTVASDAGVIQYEHGGGADAMVFKTATNEAMRIDSSGKVGIATTSMTYNLNVESSAGEWLYLTRSGGPTFKTNASGSAVFLGTVNSYPLVFQTNSSEAMRIDSSGNVNIGTTGATNKLVVKRDSTTTATNAQIVSENRTGATGQYALYATSLDNGSGAGFKPVVFGAVQTAAAGRTADFVIAVSDTDNVDLSSDERLRINSSGFVGIATTDPQNELDVRGTVEIGNGSTQRMYLQGTGTDFRFYDRANLSERVRIDSSGNVGIGTSSPGAKLDVAGPASVTSFTGTTRLGVTVRGSSSTNDYSGIDIIGGNLTTPVARIAALTTGGGSTLSFGTSNSYASGITNTAMTIDTSGSLLVGSSTAKTKFYSDSTYNGIYNGSSLGSNESIYMGNGAIFFYAAASERMRIDSSGNVLIGTTSYAAGQEAKMIQPGQMFSSRNTTVSAGHISFQNPNGSVGQIFTNGSSTTYSTSSDYRLKENVTADWDATTRLKQLNPVRFNFIADADTTLDGFLAHEVQSVVPEAITGTHNEVDDDGNPVYQGIDQSKLVPLLVKTIQELEARIAALESA